MRRTKTNLFGMAGLSALMICLSAMRTEAGWVTMDLPDLTEAWGGTALAHLDDGRFVFAETGRFHLQETWEESGTLPFATQPEGSDPSFILHVNDGLAVVGRGGWGSSDLDTFNPSLPSEPGFEALGFNLQNYDAAARDAASFYLAGLNGTQARHAVGIVDWSLGIHTLVIDDISAHSCGIASDAAGNLYVGNNDDGKVYRFTFDALTLALTEGPLSIADGTYVHDFRSGGNLGTLAVDGQGRIWTAGWASDGLTVYDPETGWEMSVIPHLENANYKVATFSRAGVDYVAFMNQEAPWQDDSAQYYGYIPAADIVVIPEPGSLLLWAVAGGVLYLRKKS